MYTFRFNPVFKQWVLLGAPVATPLEITPGHLIDVGKRHNFAAASHPRSPFLLDPPARYKQDDHLLYADQPPVGEYEFLLYSGEEGPVEWTAKQWDAWLMLVQQRILQLHHNPYIHFFKIVFNTSALHSIPGYQRVGDIIATSHAIAGSPAELSPDLVDKLRNREAIFMVAVDEHGALYVPPAPLYEKEVWYLPDSSDPGIESMSKGQRSSLAHSLTVLFRALHKEFPEEHFTLTIHTSVAGNHGQATWWIQVHQLDRLSGSSLRALPLPEAFLQHLHFLLAHHSSR